MPLGSAFFIIIRVPSPRSAADRRHALGPRTVGLIELAPVVVRPVARYQAASFILLVAIYYSAAADVRNCISPRVTFDADRRRRNLNTAAAAADF